MLNLNWLNDMEDFVNYDIAVKLKEKGFKDKCFGYYTPEGYEFLPVQTPFYGGDYEDCMFSHNDMCQGLDGSDCIDAPTISQVLKWLREVYHIHFEVVGAAYGYNLIISDTPDKGGTDRYYSYARNDGPNDGGAWDSFEDCVNYGIEYVLNNLI